MFIRVIHELKNRTIIISYDISFSLSGTSKFFLRFLEILLKNTTNDSLSGFSTNQIYVRLKIFEFIWEF